jgi:hypothetical protein
VTPKKDEEKAENLEVTILSGLLDFHSDRAEAQASFLVACIFGSFALLTVVQNIENTILIFLSMIPYAATSLIGLHCLQRFGYYANVAQLYETLLFDNYVDMNKIHPRIYGWREHARTLEDKEPVKQHVERLSRNFAGILERFKKAWIINLTALGIFGIPALIVYFGQIFL